MSYYVPGYNLVTLFVFSPWVNSTRTCIGVKRGSIGLAQVWVMSFLRSHMSYYVPASSFVIILSHCRRGRGEGVGRGRGGGEGEEPGGQGGGVSGRQGKTSGAVVGEGLAEGLAWWGWAGTGGEDTLDAN